MWSVENGFKFSNYLYTLQSITLLSFSWLDNLLKWSALKFLGITFDCTNKGPWIFIAYALESSYMIICLFVYPYLYQLYATSFSSVTNFLPSLLIYHFFFSLPLLWAIYSHKYFCLWPSTHMVLPVHSLYPFDQSSYPCNFFSSITHLILFLKHTFLLWHSPSC